VRRDDLAAMSIDERLDEVASLLAGGFLRLKRRTGCLPPDERATAAHSNDSGAAGGLLAAVPAKRSLTVAARTETSESAVSSTIPEDWPCHLSEKSAPC